MLLLFLFDFNLYPINLVIETCLKKRWCNREHEKQLNQIQIRYEYLNKQFRIQKMFSNLLLQNSQSRSDVSYQYNVILKNFHLECILAKFKIHCLLLQKQLKSCFLFIIEINQSILFSFLFFYPLFTLVTTPCYNN